MFDTGLKVLWCYHLFPHELGTSAEIPYWQCVTTQIWVVLLIGWSKFPSRYHYFPLLSAGNFKRVMSLRDATTKMSKSDLQEMSRIELSDSPDTIKTKIQKATTDSEKHISYDPQNRPEMSNLINIYAEFSGLSHQQVCDRYQNMEKCKKAFKADLTELIVSELSFVRDNVSTIQQDESYVDSVLSTGAYRARNIAEANLREIKQMIGLR